MAFSVYACCVLRCAGSYAAGLCAKWGAQRALITLSRFMCTFEFASFAAFRDGQRGAAGRVLGFSVRTLCVLRAAGDLRDLATRNAKMSHCGGDSWLQWSQYKLLPTGGWAVDLVRARVSPSGRLVRAAGLPLFRMAVIFLLLGRRGTRGSAAFAETAGVARWACFRGGAFDEGWSLWTFVCVSLRDVNARAHRRWAEINDGWAGFERFASDPRARLPARSFPWFRRCRRSRVFAGRGGL